MTDNNRPIAYQWRAALYHPDCMKDAAFTAFAFSPVPTWGTLTPEVALTRVADGMGINRADENSFDSDDFPKVAWSVEPADTCDRCGEAIVEQEEHVERCPACGETMWYCPGHGPIGDANGYGILRMHGRGDHTACRLIAGCPLLDDRAEGVYYLGPIAPAVRVVEDDGETIVLSGHVTKPMVTFCTPSHVTLETGEEVRMLNWNTFGGGASINEALRFALGSHFGPIDEEYDEDRLRRVLLEREQ